MKKHSLDIIAWIAVALAFGLFIVILSFAGKVLNNGLNIGAGGL